MPYSIIHNHPDCKKESGETGIMKVAACNMGMANANLKMNAHIKGVIDEATSPNGKK